MFQFHRFKVSLQHDKGIVHLIVGSSSAEAAAETVCRAESAPPSAVIKVEQL